MKKLGMFIFALLIIYSLLMFFLEIKTSQEYIRNYFTDIKGPVLFFAVNTTVCVFLAWGTALIFSICLMLISSEGERKERFFLWSQVIIFIYLGCDDRFMFHEHFGVVFGVKDALILGAIGVVEVILLLGPGNFFRRPGRIRQPVYFAAIFFGAMIVIDGLFPARMTGRLALEDLCKLWAYVFLFYFAWEVCRGKVGKIKESNQ